MAEFAQAAFPWICIGIAVAVAMRILTRRNKREK